MIFSYHFNLFCFRIGGGHPTKRGSSPVHATHHSRISNANIQSTMGELALTPSPRIFHETTPVPLEIAGRPHSHFLQLTMQLAVEGGPCTPVTAWLLHIFSLMIVDHKIWVNHRIHVFTERCSAARNLFIRKPVTLFGSDLGTYQPLSFVYLTVAYSKNDQKWRVCTMAGGLYRLLN